MKNILFSKKRKILYSFIFSILFSTLQVIGYNCYKFDTAKLYSITTYLWILLITIITYIITNLIWSIPIIKSKKIKASEFLFNKKYSFFLLLLLIIICWLPVLISFFPGNFSYDAGTQIRMLLFDVVTKYHPVMHTAFLGITIYLGHAIFNSWNIGLLIHSIVQMIIMAGIFSYTLIYLYKKKVPSYLLLFFLIIYLFLPTHSVFSITTTKDVLFSGLFNIVLICYIELCTNKKFFTKKNMIITILSTFLLISFRNNMIYAFILFIPFILLYYKKDFKKLSIIFVSILAITIIYDKALTHIFKIENGPRVEMFSFVVQQFARTYNKDNISKEYKEDIKLLFLNNSLKDYNSHLSDPVKSNFNTEELLNNKKKYIKLYTHLLIENPNTFIDSILNNTYSFYYLFDKLPDPNTKTYIELNCIKEVDNSIERNDNCKFNNNILFKIVNDAEYQKIPLLNVFMNMAFYFIVLLFAGIFALYKKNYKLFFPLLLLIFYMGTNMLAPVALVRYAYPLFTTFPIIIYIYYQTKKDRI